jgi:serine/threonine-protein kinase
MTLHPEACDPRRLDRFLHHPMEEDLPRDLEAHLQVCPACRNKLDELAGGDRWWTEVRRYLGGDGASEPPARLKTSVGSQTSEAFPALIKLDFLEPSAHPTSLGRLGSYEILEPLGRGGMGIVLKAFDPALHRPVAIKVLAEEYAANGAARKRFAREAVAAAAVIHDHVVPVHAVDADAPRPYLVMAMISGRSLQQRIDHSGPLELKEILRIGMQTASGLAAAHAQGLVHRDIKPANIMLENGIERVRITDFGLARAVDDSSVTQNGVLTGTPQYMAPEQARGEPVDQRADLFSLGSTLYAMCTGRSPFRADSSISVLKQVCEAEPMPIRSINPDIPAWLQGIIAKLHAKDPAGRFQSAAEVADLLERCLAHVQQPDQHPLPQLAKELGRRIAVAKLKPVYRLREFGTAAVAALALAALIWVISFVWNHRNADTNAEAASAADPDPAAMTPDNQIDQDLAQMRNRLGELQQSLSAAGQCEAAGTPYDQLRGRAEALQRDLCPASEANADSLDSQLQDIRRRLEQLKQNVGAGWNDQ